MPQVSTSDKLKSTLAGLITATGLYFSLLYLVQSSVPLRFGIFVATLALAGGLMYFSEPGRRFVAYCKDASLEVRKVVWPHKDEVLKMSGVVIVFVTIVAIFLWLVDALLAWLLQFITF